MLALAVAMGIGRFAFTPILPMMRADSGLSLVQGAQLASANYLGYLIGALSAMTLRMSATSAIKLTLAAVATLTAAMALSGQPVVWLLLRFTCGAASAWTLIFVSIWAPAQLAALERPALVGLVFSGVGFGIFLAGLLCVALMRLNASAATAWWVMGGCSVLLSALVWPQLREAAPAVAKSAAPEAAWAGTATRVKLILCYGSFGFAYIIPATFLPVMARNVIRDQTMFGWAWPAFGVAAAVSTIVAGRLSQRFAQRRIWAAGNVIMAAGLILPVLSASFTAIVAAALLVGGTFMIITMAGMQEARRLSRDGSRRLVSAMTAAFAIGQILGPLAAAGAGGQDARFSVALTVAALMLMVSTAVLRLADGVPRAAPS